MCHCLQLAASRRSIGKRFSPDPITLERRPRRSMSFASLYLNPSILRSMNRGVDLWCRLFAGEKSCLSSEFYSCRFLFWH